MKNDGETSLHDKIVTEIISTCSSLDFKAHKEYRGPGWRADVCVEKELEKIAFEVQLSPQSLTKTLIRQEKYIREGIKGCWLALHPIIKLDPERKDLPVFYVSIQNGSSFVSLVDKRKIVQLPEFIKAFLLDEIKYCETVRTNRTQNVKINFLEMKCWKCNAINHIYYVDRPFTSMCNYEIYEEDELWSDKQQHFKPEIISAVREILDSKEGQCLKVGSIKERYSNTVQNSYLSFGCYECDSIFGDWYVLDEVIDARSCDLSVASFNKTIALKKPVIEDRPHWCFPENGNFCDSVDT